MKSRERQGNRRQPQRSALRRALCAGATLWLAVTAANAVAATCSVSTPGLAFGAYNVFSAAVTNGTGTLTIACSRVVGEVNVTVSYVISLSTGSSNSFVQRQMKSGANTLGYNLYTTNTHAVVWGDGTGSTQTVTGSLKLSNANPTRSVSVSAFGQIPALQDVAVANNYQDNVTVTVTY